MHFLNYVVQLFNIVSLKSKCLKEVGVEVVIGIIIGFIVSFIALVIFEFYAEQRRSKEESLKLFKEGFEILMDSEKRKNEI